MKKKEIVLNKNIVQFVLLAIIAPLILTFILEHFGEFKASSLGETSYNVHKGSNYKKIRLHTRTFHTVFGNKIEENLYKKNIPAYRETKKGTLLVSPNYGKQIRYYAKAVVADIAYPISFSLIIIAIFMFRRKFALKLN
ncbi:hypothetical protein D7030_00155 [Flavobacteriaceae bacterium AU392]|nr:hypothetical protein D1817_14280 [Flavobacteriaceae bacterium]RKM86946.1 hypothetical protein D7030_00155 [Flavobacteriaceae bacterium AU392]